MSEFSCPIVKIEKVDRHPNADTLSIMQVMGENVIFKTDAFKEGDLAVYVPEDAVLPDSVPGTEFLGQNRRIRAKRLRGIFSCGLLLPTAVLPLDTEGMDNVAYEEPDALIGFDVAGRLGIKKYEEPESFGGENERDPGYMPKYDIESHRKYGHVFVPGERVVITEKLHGTSFRALWRDDRLYVGSHGCIKRDGDTVYWRAARQYKLAELLNKCANIAVYGEVFGWVQDLRYDCASGEVKLAIFDAYDTKARRWLDWGETVWLANDLGLPLVPVVQDGPYDALSIAALADGKSLVAGHNREGVVIKPATGRRDQELGRVITKFVGEWYRLRKGGTEHH